MSLNFNQIVSTIHRNVKTSTASYPLADMVVDINLAFDCILPIIFKACGKWQFDDTNHTDYPIITTSLVSGQRDYTFVEDQQGNLILDVYKVMVKDANGYFVEIFPVDQQSDEDMESFYDGRNVTGIPTRYDKTANGFFLDCIPSYNSTNGLKVFINREASYFTVSDSTKKPGIAGLFHEYFALRPSFQYAYRNNLASATKLEQQVDKMEEKIKSYYSGRAKDEPNIMRVEQISSV